MYADSERAIYKYRNYVQGQWLDAAADPLVVYRDLMKATEGQLDDHLETVHSRQEYLKELDEKEAEQSGLSEPDRARRRMLDEELEAAWGILVDATCKAFRVRPQETGGPDDGLTETLLYRLLCDYLEFLADLKKKPNPSSAAPVSRVSAPEPSLEALRYPTASTAASSSKQAQSA